MDLIILVGIAYITKTSSNERYSNMTVTLFFCRAPDDEHAQKHLIKHDVNFHYLTLSIYLGRSDFLHCENCFEAEELMSSLE